MPGMVFENRLVTLRKPAWWDVHGVQVFEEPLPLLAAGQLAGAYVPLEVRPLEVRLSDDPDAPTVLAPDRAALVRAAAPLMAGPGTVQMDDDGRPVWSPAQYLTHVSPTYPLLQNRDICARLNPITIPRSDGGEWWPVESVGMLHHGATLVISLNMGGMQLAGEDYSNTCGLIENRAGAAMMLMHTTTRIVCRNTAIAALAGSEFVIRVPHTQNFLAEADAAIQLMIRAREVQGEFRDLAEALVKAPLAMTEAAEIVARLWTVPDEPAIVKQAEAVRQAGVDVSDLELLLQKKRRAWELERTRMLRRQDLTLDTYDRIVQDSTLGKVGGRSAWAFYQAVVEVCDHEDKVRGDRALSALVGERAGVKNQALAAMAARLN